MFALEELLVRLVLLPTNAMLDSSAQPLLANPLLVPVDLALLTTNVLLD